VKSIVRISDLSPEQRGHMAWRLDHKTACGYLTALRIARMELGDMAVQKVFIVYGCCTRRSAKIQATKCANFNPNNAVRVK
jgi:hypothetical protein